MPEQRHRVRAWAASCAVLAAAVAAGCGAAAPPGTTAGQAPDLPAAAVPAAERAEVTQAVGLFADALRTGDVEQLCRPGAVFTPAVVADLNSGGQSCEASLEVSGVLANPPTLAVTGLTAKPGLATAQVRVGEGSTIPIDLVADGRRWLVSFSNGIDPISVLNEN